MHTQFHSDVPWRQYAHLRNLSITASLLFVVAISLSLVWFQLRSEQAIRDGVLARARAHAIEFNAVRTYVQSFSGIYVPASEEITANPHLAGAKGVAATMTAPSGQVLVLQNSPLVAEAVSDILSQNDLGESVSMRLCGSQPLNPANAPDAFGRQAIKRLTAGETEVYAFGKHGDADVFRYALGVPATEACGRCHPDLVGVTSGVAGATIVEMEVAQPLTYVTESRRWTFAVISLISLVSVVIVYFFVTRFLKGTLHAQNQVYEMARFDSLTGLMNRTAGMASLNEEVERAGREQHSLACCVLDLDDFKSINDDHGHTVGDHVLAEVGRSLKSSVRPYDVAARVGGEEFLLILPQIPLEGACEIIDRFRASIVEASAAVPKLDRLVTCSAGVAMLDPSRPETAHDLYVRADRALLEAKHAGKDRCVIAPSAA